MTEWCIQVGRVVWIPSPQSLSRLRFLGASERKLMVFIEDIKTESLIALLRKKQLANLAWPLRQTRLLKMPRSALC